MKKKSNNILEVLVYYLEKNSTADAWTALVWTVWDYLHMDVESKMESLMSSSVLCQAVT